ncbi:MAG: M23 family metallopeptidase [Candidatus Methylomirabilales bacterium]
MARLEAGVASLCLFFLFSLSFDGCAPRPRFPPKRRPQGIHHVVKSGENLFRIGKAYDVNYQELARINKIADLHRIRAGQRIFIPGATRRLPVEIITPSKVTVKRPITPKPRGKGREGFIWPVRGDITSKFGRRSRTFHDGIDIAAPQGAPIRAIQKGKVMYSDRLRGYGNILIIRHLNGFVSVYAHNRRNIVREGQRVAQGEVIAEVGSTGRVTGPHLHFEVRKNNVARDPLYYLP